MRPTPAETITQVRRLLKEVIGPDLQSDYARGRLAEIRAILAQMEWDNAAAQLAARNAELAQLTLDCARWAEESPQRRPVLADLRDAIAGIRQQPPVLVPRFEDLNESNRAYATLLISVADRIAQWGTEHPEDTSVNEQLDQLIDYFAGDARAADTRGVAP